MVRSLVPVPHMGLAWWAAVGWNVKNWAEVKERLGLAQFVLLKTLLA
jgi:hypothetical protein